ncbi:YbaB/EbfC family nucleoid-associated protein [Mycobacteroides abscessus]|uniref:YbaB/EbfC family nucleoid-associated protein n=1 Tax=Mycobacteroides abscessus TaxID=36809 RepID=UPI000C265D44|nr:YbaB/EbfC family nucleoid-associated protein [Mycobacteroides abscessus]
MNPDAGLADLMRTAARVNEAVSQVRGHGESAGGWVKIEVAGDGAISNMYLDDRTRSMAAHELGRAIRDAQRAAIANALHRVHQIQSEVTENSYVTTVLNQLQSPEPGTPQALPRSVPQRRAAGGMSDEELDASQDAFNFDPLGRRNRH